MSTRIVIRPADLISEREGLIEILYRCLTPLSDVRRFNWLYEKNPHGRARAWVASRVDDETIVGMAGAFPRRIYVNGREERCWVLGDFCIDDEYRSLGPALQLQQACLSDVGGATVDFCYDFPSAGMMAVYKRLRIDPVGRMLRFAKPLRVDRKIREWIKSPPIHCALSRTGNLLLKFRERRAVENPTFSISLHEGHCDEEFSELAKHMGIQYGVCLQRSAEYLNWRYMANPLCHYELLTARRGGELLAYAVFADVGENATLVDLFGVEELSVISTLLDRLVHLLRERGVVTVSASMIESHPWIGLLEHAGFKVRESCPVVVYAPSRTSLFKEVKWFLMHGDRDS